jgi:uncharacterized membrane protein
MAGIEALGSNLHPMIVHFPIAFLFGFILCEVVGLAARRPVARHWASGMLYLGAMGAVVAATAGIIASNTVPHGAAVHDIMEWHERLGLTVAVLAVAMAGWRFFGGEPEIPMAKALHLGVAGLIAGCLYLGADLGGLMVYKYGVGVQSLQRPEEAVQHLHTGVPAAPAAETAAVAAPGPAPAEPSPAAPQAPAPATSAMETDAGHNHRHHHHHPH